jgi:hypothetical protein
MMLEAFDDGDEPFLTWMAGHPNGFVLNRRSGGKSSNYLVLHRSGCRMVSSYSGMARSGAFTTRGYVKICSTELDELRSYVRNKCERESGDFTGHCDTCKPL